MIQKEIKIKLKNDKVIFEGFKGLSKGTVTVYHIEHNPGSKQTTPRQIAVDVEGEACDDIRLAEIVAENTKGEDMILFEEVVPDENFPECVFYLQNAGKGGLVICHIRKFAEQAT